MSWKTIASSTVKMLDVLAQLYWIQHAMPMPRRRYSVQVVPIPCSTTGFPFRKSWFEAVDHVCGGDGGGTGGGGGGGGGTGPHHLALLPPLLEGVAVVASSDAKRHDQA